jgi:hypothetical protein
MKDKKTGKKSRKRLTGRPLCEKNFFEDLPGQGSQD